VDIFDLRGWGGISGRIAAMDGFGQRIRDGDSGRADAVARVASALPAMSPVTFRA